MKHALFISGGWDGHKPEVSADIFSKALREQDYEVKLTDDLEVLVQDDLSQYDLIVPNWTMGEISGDQSKALVAAVEAGTGLGGWHGGAGDAFRGNIGFQWLVGGQFLGHPGNIIDYTVDIVDGNHPVTAGLSTFRMHSEQYYMMVDPGAHILATTTFTGAHCAWVEGVVMPTVWVKPWGKGRVFYCALGHQPSDFEVPEVHTIITRGLRWATR